MEDIAFRRHPDSAQDRTEFLRLVLRADLDREIYRGTPVSPEVFLYSPFYLNRKGFVYPEVFKAYVELNSGRYNRAILTGGTGSGKSTTVNPSMLYQIYLLSMMHCPHTVMRLDPASEVLNIIQAMKRDVAKDQYDRVRALVDGSPYFNEMFTYDRNQKSKIVFPNRIEIRAASGETTDLIGKNIYQLHLNEANFMGNVTSSKRSDGGEFDQAMALYSYGADRRQNRFTVAGKVRGMIYVDSSQRYPGQLTDVLEAEVKEEIERTGKTETFIYRKRAWDVKPEGTYTEWFFVFKGDDTRKPKIIQESEISSYSKEDQEKYIDKGPATLISSWLLDAYQVLRDAFGWATLASHPFIPNVDLLAACFKPEQQSIFTEFQTTLNEHTLGFRDVEDPSAPRWCHIDLSRTGDSTGLVIGHVDRFTRVNRGDVIEMLPHITIDGSLEILPPTGGEIDYGLIRQILYALRDKRGLNIKWVSFDQYQSVDSQQILRQKGFKTGQQSMDRVPVNPYKIAKTAFMDGRVSAPNHVKLFDELRGLEYNPKTGRVDHNPLFSKDVADACGAVVFRLSTAREIWRIFGIRPNQIPESLRAGSKSKDED